MSGEQIWYRREGGFRSRNSAKSNFALFRKEWAEP